MPLVTIVMPAYKAEATIARAIRAVIAQDLPDWELIVCDDGSKDGTAGKVLGLADDARISLHCIDHMGVSNTRNFGLTIAQGDFIAFLDADDEPRTDWLSSLVSLIDGADLAACGYDVVGEDGSRLYGTDPVIPAGVQTITAEQFTCDIFSNRLMYQGYVWNKLFRRDLIEQDEPLRFTRGIAYNEDRLFIYGYLKRCSCVAIEGTARYSYRASADSAVYHPSQATEISAFDLMASDLKKRIASGEPLEDALRYLEKDTFRAAVELFWAANSAGDPDALWLIDRVHALSEHRDDFSDYPAEFQSKLAAVID